jgi:hypothetical protein
VHYLDFTYNQDLNPRVLRIIDNSSYDETIPVSNGLVEVIPPGFNYSFIFRVNKGFTLTLNANLLGLNSMGSKALPNLVDGLYKIKYSVDPNAIVNIEYYHFRSVIQERYYLHLLNELKDLKCVLTNREYSKRQKELFTLKEYILG